jgi:hypothetical protein
MTPDITTNGNLIKRWLIDGKKRFLIKGSDFYNQEALNEVIASEMMNRLGIRHIPYDLVNDDKAYIHNRYSYHTIFSKCENFINRNTEFVSAWNIYISQKQENDVWSYKQFLIYCSKLGIPDMKEFLDKMLTLDYIIGNTDRHLNNFGAIRDANTLEWIGPAPIYDCGNSLWSDNDLINSEWIKYEIESRPFKKIHSDQIKLIGTFDWLDLKKLGNIDNFVYKLYSHKYFTNISRKDIIIKLLNQRIKNFENIINSIQKSNIEI